MKILEATRGGNQNNLPADRLVAGRHAAPAVRYSRRGRFLVLSCLGRRVVTESELLAATGNAWRVHSAGDWNRAVYVRAKTPELATRIAATKLKCRNLVARAWDPCTERWGGGVQVREVGDA